MLWETLICICANTTDIVKNFAFMKSVSINYMYKEGSLYFLGFQDFLDVVTVAQQAGFRLV